MRKSFVAVKVVTAACCLATMLVLISGCVGIQAVVTPSTGTFTPATISRVVDGDTIVVVTEKQVMTVRLIGIDCPESVNPDESKNTPAGVAASDYTKALVTPGQVVWLECDTSDTDRYDRYLRYVWLAPPLGEQATIEEVKTKMLNAHLVADGYAKAKRYEPDTRYAVVFENLEKEYTHG